MGQARPELIFVAGPQQGERAILMKNVVVLGRASSCDVHLAEPSASRQQVRIERTREGWVMADLSSNRTRVNGKRFKAKARVLLETGDVLGVGTGTEILFVAPPDDPEEVLAKYREAHPVGEAPPQPAEAPPPAEKKLPSSAPAGAGAGLTEEEEDRKAQMKRYAVLGAVVLAGLLGVIAIALLRTRGGGGGPPHAARWDKDDIADALKEPLSRVPNSGIAAERLERANRLAGRWIRDGDLQTCVKNYKLSLAYYGRKQMQMLPDPSDQRQYEIALGKLIHKVQEDYREGWVREQDGKWSEADAIWQLLLRVLPHDPEWDTRGYGDLRSNLMSHAAYARQNLGKK